MVATIAKVNFPLPERYGSKSKPVAQPVCEASVPMKNSNYSGNKERNFWFHVAFCTVFMYNFI